MSGVLTTHLGALEDGRKAFIQDDTGGIALYLDAAVLDGLPADVLVVVRGMLDERFAERTLRVAIIDIVSLGEQQRPPPWQLLTGEIGEAHEGWRAIVQGVTVGSPTELSDGLGLMVDDGSGQVRVIVGPAALAGASVPSGTHVVAVGPVGQRDSSGTGLAGYRVHATEPSDFGVLPAPTPTPTATPATTPTPTATSTPTSRTHGDTDRRTDRDRLPDRDASPHDKRDAVAVSDARTDRHTGAHAAAHDHHRRGTRRADRRRGQRRRAS